MTDFAFSSRQTPVYSGTDFDTAFRSVFFVAVFLMVWVSLHPFQSLAEPPQAESSDRLNQIAFLAAFVCAAAWVYFNGPERLRPLVQPAAVLTVLWFGLSVFTSWEPETSARRLIFTLIVLALGAVVLVLPRNLRHFTDLLATAVLIVLALSYAGLLLAPSLSIHQATDFLEPEHEGNWRGVFAHKNQAGAIMDVFIMIGLYVAQRRNLFVGGVIIALSTIFLLFAGSKTAWALLPLVLAVSAFVTRVRPFWAMSVALGVLVAFNLFSIGTVIFEPIRVLVTTVLPDATFTGRTDIWTFAFEYVMRRPITGYGFSSFWGTEQVMYGLGEIATWATSATDAHNAYLNLALTVGLPGLAFMLWWFVWQPIRDFHRFEGDAGSRDLSVMFLRIWLIGVYVSSFESALFPQGGAVWFMYVVSVFGLRMLTVARLRH
jgi:O-antigen ligase